jgi:hypothetical protein
MAGKLLFFDLFKIYIIVSLRMFFKNQNLEVTKSASSFVRNFRSSTSNTPSASLRKNRGMPFSKTLPLGLSMAAVGATFTQEELDRLLFLLYHEVKGE